jgi:hypothetical protein
MSVWFICDERWDGELQGKKDDDTGRLGKEPVWVRSGIDTNAVSYEDGVGWSRSGSSTERVR